MVAVARVRGVARLLLDADIVAGHRVAGHRMADTLHHDAKTFAATGAIILNIAAHRIAGDPYPGRHIHVARQYSPPESGNARQITLFTWPGINKTAGEGHDVITYRDVRAIAVRVFDLYAEAAVIGYRVGGNYIRSGAAGETHCTHAIVKVIVHIITRHGYARSRTVL